MIKAGQKFPDFRLANQDGRESCLKDYLGKWLVLYVYPKDDTPGCTIQGKSFTAQKAAFEKLNVTVVGISADDVQSHKEFCKKYSLTVELLSDPGAQLLKTAGVPQSEYKGTMYWERTTFVIDPSGTVVKTYDKVNPQGHEEALLKDLAELQHKK